MSIKLRDLIRAVRACKTAAEERAVISKECALIRTAIKEEDDRFRQRNVAKLMFIHMLGYPTHFGQMECLKLISAPTFPEKRIGYLALTLLLTEQTEVLMLVTNSLKLDLTNSNQYIQALSLITIGNLSTPDMARDLASDVEKLLRSNNSYLRKKAALATIRLLQKEPDLIEHMGERIVGLLKDRSHGVLISGIQLMIDVSHIIPEEKAEYVKLVPALVRLLRNFISMGFSPEHDVAGITDPFVQVKIIHLLRILGKGSEEASDQMNDVLAQVATNTETTKNAGNAILYECVQTIMGVESDSNLRVLAVNILGRFLLNRDNNIRYVALNSLAGVVAEDVAAVQRHRTTIVDCLKDPDVSIRQRALELTCQLVNDQNVVGLTAELLNYLVVANAEHKPNLVSKIMQIVEVHSPTKKWRVETIITMLSIAGSIADESIPRTAIIFIAQSEGLQGYAAHRLFRCLQEDSSQMGLLQVAIWCIGEYGSLLVRDCGAPDADSNGFSAVSEKEVLGMMEKCLKIYNADLISKCLVLNALMKLSVRMSASTKAAVLQIITPFTSSMSLELQQRAVEYCTLLGSSQWDKLRSDLLDKMPVLDEAAIRKRRAQFEDATLAPADSDDVFGGGNQQKAAAPSGGGGGGASFARPTGAMPLSEGGVGTGGGGSLLDLDDIFGGGGGGAAVMTPQQSVQPSVNLMGDIFGGSPAPVPQQHYHQQQQQQHDPFGMGDVLSAMPTAAPQQQQQYQAQPMSPQPPAAPQQQRGGFIAASPSSTINLTAYEKNGFKVTLEVRKPDASNPANTVLICKFANMNGQALEGLIFQAAVPKYLKLEMLPPTSTTIPANSNGAVTQEVRLNNSMQGQKNIMLKLKIGYTIGGNKVDEVAQVSNFPALY